MDEHYEKTVQDIREYYETIILCMPGNVYWLDTSLRARGCNQNVLDMFGLDDIHQFIGLSFEEMAKVCGWSPIATQKFKSESIEVLHSKLPLLNREDPPITHANGNVIHFLTHRVPILDKNNNILGVVGISIDNTERKEMIDKLEHANSAKSQFIANMSHDIRTPLTGIVGLSDILFDTVSKPENKEYAKMLHLSGEQLLSLLNSVLEVVSSESISHDVIEFHSFALAEVLHNIFELQLPALKLKNLSLELQLDDDIPATIRTDKGKLYRIILNLLSNSIKFTEQGSISIHISKQDKGDNQSILCFDIIDTGIGIPKTETNKIFHAFYRVHPSYEGKYLGFGVGLHLVKQYVDALKGNISVKSVEGMGTRFRLLLPVEIPESDHHPIEADTKESLLHVIDDLNRPNESPPQPSMTLTAEGENSRAKTEAASAHILLVEDNPMAMKIADMIVRKQGATTDKAYNAHEALSLFKNNHYDFVLTDIGLPDFSGFELTRKIKTFEKETNAPPTPIIGLTAHAKQEALLQGNQCGMLEVCEKPLTAKTALSYIDLFGSHKKTQAQHLSEPSPTSSDIPLLDVELGISQLGSIEDLKEMLDIMIKQSMVVTVNDIDASFQNQDWPAFKKQVHKFKSSCLYCATTKLLKLTQDLEGLADSNDLNQIEPVYQQFCDCVISTHQYIESWLSMKWS
ncbi:MAG: response regulator [Legionellaceae bacterium]|nr:response regulator [Legionellaceae bacterium]